MNRLTTAYLLNKREILHMLLKKSNLLSDHSKPYYLVIVAVDQSYSKITVYPVTHKIILKIIIGGSKLDHSSVSKIIDVLSKFKILHTSGIVAIKNGFLYELYVEGITGEDKSIPEYYYQLKKIEGVDTLEEEWIKKQTLSKSKFINFFKKK